MLACLGARRGLLCRFLAGCALSSPSGVSAATTIATSTTATSYSCYDYDCLYYFHAPTRRFAHTQAASSMGAEAPQDLTEEVFGSTHVDSAESNKRNEDEIQMKWDSGREG